jgi:hypothetical protein
MFTDLFPWPLFHAFVAKTRDSRITVPSDGATGLSEDRSGSERACLADQVPTGVLTSREGHDLPYVSFID